MCHSHVPNAYVFFYKLWSLDGCGGSQFLGEQFTTSWQRPSFRWKHIMSKQNYACMNLSVPTPDLSVFRLSSNMARYQNVSYC